MYDDTSRVYDDDIMTMEYQVLFSFCVLLIFYIFYLEGILVHHHLSFYSSSSILQFTYSNNHPSYSILCLTTNYLVGYLLNLTTTTTTKFGILILQLDVNESTD
jgi:hypothetical protein